MKKGSAIVMVVAITAYIMVIAIPVICMAAGSTALSRSSGDMDGAYYISEAGIERSMAIMENDICSYMSSTDTKSIQDPSGKIDIDDLKALLDGFTAPYFISFRNGSIMEFEGDGSEKGCGMDTVLFSSYMLFPSYYNIASVVLGETKLYIKDDSYIYDIPFSICTLGSTKNACREIKARYILSVVFDIPESNNGEEKENSETAEEDGSFCINIIDCCFKVTDLQD